MSVPPSPSPQRGISTSTPARAGAAKNFADVAIDKGFITPEQLVWAMAEHQRLGGADEFADFLIRAKLLSAEQIKECERWLRAPKIIGGFEILEKVGQGGMGSVFRAKQISMDRIVALKILPPSLAQDPSFKKRFLHEAQLSAKFNHLNIISGIDCGEDKGLTYFAMEFVDGRTLKQLLKEQGKLEPDVAAELVQQVAVALVYAEGHKLVHRDIKPDNIMLTSANVAKLCDLGLAKLTTANGDSFQTQAGMAVGTPHYISPEQARGDANVDSRSDIYSLGATFYHLLTGKTPFNAPTSASVMALHLTESAPNPCDIDHSIPIGYGQVLAKMMAKEPDDRYLLAQDLVDDLEQARNRKPTAAANCTAKSSCLLPARMSKTTGGATTGPRQPITLERRDPPRFRKGAILGWLVTVVVCGGGAFVIWKYFIDPPQTVAQIPVTAPKEKQPDKPEPVKVPSGLIAPDKLESVAVKPTVPEPKKAPTVPAPPKEAPKAVVAVAPTAPVAPERPAIVAAAVKAPAPDPEPARAEMTVDIVYARALKEFAAMNARDLNKLKSDVSDMVRKSEYKLARALIEQDEKDIDAAIQYEQNALKAIAAAGGNVDLNEDTARRFGAKQGKIKGFDPARGLMIDVNGAVITQNASVLPMKDILKASPDGTALAQVRYRTIKGDLEGARGMLNALKDENLQRWSQRLKLVDEKAEFELLAEEEFKALQKEALAHHWQNTLKLIPEFQKAFGTTPAWIGNQVTIQEWKKEAQRALAPPEALEATGTWGPLTLPGFNTCKVKTQSEPAFGTKFVRGSGGGEEGFDRTGIVRMGAEPLDVATAQELHFLARNLSTEPVKMAVVFAADEKIFESPAIEIPASSQQRVTLWVKCSEYKQVIGPDQKYDKKLPPGYQPNRLIFLVLTKSGFSVDIDGVVLK